VFEGNEPFKDAFQLNPTKPDLPYDECILFPFSCILYLMPCGVQHLTHATGDFLQISSSISMKRAKKYIAQAFTQWE